MNPKKIIIKTLNKELCDNFCKGLASYPRMNYFSRKINGEYVIVIKCENYYKPYTEGNVKNIYKSYIYLYTNVCFVITDIIIRFFEERIINFYFNEYKPFFSKSDIQKAKNISSLLLDPNFPSESARKLFLYKKDLIFNRLILNFRKRNYLNIESFALFSLDNYHAFLSSIATKSFDMFLDNSLDEDLINFILNNFFK